MRVREGCLWSRAIHHPIRPPQADLTQSNSGVVHTQCRHGGQMLSMSHAIHQIL